MAGEESGVRKLDEPVRPDTETIEEGVRIKGKVIVTGPSREEYEEHMRTHIPFGNWCEFCVKGKCESDPHRKSGPIKAKYQGTKYRS